MEFFFLRNLFLLLWLHLNVFIKFVCGGKSYIFWINEVIATRKVGNEHDRHPGSYYNYEFFELCVCFLVIKMATRSF